MDQLNSALEQLSLRNLREEIRTILSDQSTNRHIISIFKRIQRNALFNDYYFPLDNDDDLNYMEKKISKERTTGFRSLLVDDLIFIGGTDAKNMVIRLMTKLFTMQFLSGFTLSGYKNKSRRFLDLAQIYEVIIEAVQIKFENTTVDDINQAISGHLKDVKKPPRPPV